MERYQIILAYDGTEFLGFQRQEPTSRTVQSAVESALRCIGWEGSSILASGRTDTGVHASGQVVTFDHVWHHPEDALLRALNAHLPSDVAVRTIRKVSRDFHPRFDAHRRSYCYRVVTDAIPYPLRDRYVWRVDFPLQLRLLEEAAALLPGQYDCAAFGTAPKPEGSTIRKIYDARWEQIQEDEFHFSITANAFLYHMVRRIVFLQLQVGQGRLGLAELSAGITQEGELPGGLAPPNGLILTEVDYESPR
ncbi:MAG: tRNA pseudouridine(38-40) synthase TruA [Anaerolineae bacterium]|jgi:tRNA pseudouridine38-40 synthase|nr:tRNA pseudouridine(38-40) synthase TruA [Anaerolineae bacterium]